MIKLTASTVQVVSEQFETPSSNTGSKCQNHHLLASVDYFQGTANFPNLERLREFINFLFQSLNDIVLVEPDKPWFSGITYQHSFSSFRGGKGGYRQLENGNYHLGISIPGSCWHQINGLDQWLTLKVCHNAFRLKSTRIDFKIRDYSKRKMPSELLEQARLGNVARVKTYGSAGQAKVGSPLVETAYFGSKNSEKFLRVYHALPVHNEDAVDYENQLRDNKAQAAYLEFVKIPSCDDIEDTASLVAQYIGGVVIGSVEFIDRQENVRLSRQPVQKWWQDFVDEVGSRIRISVAKPTFSIQKKFDWIEHDVSVTLSAFRRGLGYTNFYRFIDRLLNKAEARFTDKHFAIASLCSESNPYRFYAHSK